MYIPDSCVITLNLLPTVYVLTSKIFYSIFEHFVLVIISTLQKV